MLLDIIQELNIQIVRPLDNFGHIDISICKITPPCTCMSGR